MNIKDLLQDDALKALEDQIIMSFEGLWSKDHDYTDERSLIEVRKTIINHRVLQHQDLLLPDIIAFNDAMREALREMFDKAHAVYEANKGFGEDVEVEACCYLSNDYPALHPVQGEDRQALWDALQDSGWNLLYDSGVSFPLKLTGNNDYRHELSTAQLERRPRPGTDQRPAPDTSLPQPVRPHRFCHH